SDTDTPAQQRYPQSTHSSRGALVRSRGGATYLFRLCARGGRGGSIKEGKIRRRTIEPHGCLSGYALKANPTYDATMLRG
ncbi:MAG: hypothetical protein WCH44_12840, partial [Betaproteobacteria bacterium]